MYTPIKYHAHTTTGVNILCVVGILYTEGSSVQPVGRGKHGACDTFYVVGSRNLKRENFT